MENISKNKVIKAIIISDNDTRIVQIEDSVESYSKYVNGPIALMTLKGCATAYINDLGKLDSNFSYYNIEATNFYNEYGSKKLSKGDYIAGDMIVVGYNLATGENDNIGDYYIKKLKIV